MSNGESLILGDVLDLSNKPLVKENYDISLDIKNILKDYIKDELLVTNKKEIEKILLEMSSDLQKEESISTILLAMKSSQTVNFLNINKPVLGSRSQSVKPEVGNEGIKSDEFHLTAEMSRKILDHQFVTRQKMINSQLEKALYEIPMKRNQIYYSQEFIPNTNSQEFIALVGFSEVVDVLKQEQQRQNTDYIEEKNCVDCTNTCVQCGTDASPMFKKRKTSNATEETICSTCNNDVIHSQSRKELEDQIAKLKLQFEEQEKNLIRDYNDMLSSPKKLEMFRVEQEKRHRVQRIGNSGSNKPNNNTNNNNRPSISSSQNPKSNNNNNNNNSKPPNFNLQNNNGSSSNNAMQSNKIPVKPQPAKDQPVIRPCNTSDPNQAHLTYLHFLQAFAMQASNSQQNIDQENLKKLEQVIATFQSNPMLANNNMTVLQLLANLSNQDSNTNTNTNNSVNSSNNSANNAHLMNLLSYFVNLMQTQYNQNVA